MYVEKGPEIIKRGFKELNNYLRKVGVGFDIDGTDVFSLELAINRYNEKYPGDKKKLSDVKQIHAISDWVKKREAMDEKTAWDISSKIWNNKYVLTKALPVPGATLLNNYLYSQDVIPWRITSRPSFTKKWTYEWYGYWMPWVAEESILIQTNSAEVNSDFKIAKVKEHVGVFFEDIPAHAVEIANKTNALVVMIPQLYNLGMERHPGIILPWENEKNITEVNRPAVIRSYVALARHMGFI